jgi:hypothetical protein
VSVDCTWFFYAVRDADLASIRTLMPWTEAELTPRTRAKLRHWRREPESLSEDRELINGIWRAFEDPEEVSEAVATRPALTEGEILSVTLNRACPPMALWHALGPERAARLPAFFGRMALASSDVGKAALDAESLIDEDRRDVLDRALDIVAMGNNQGIGNGEAILDAIPKACAVAAARGRGLLAFCQSA